MMMGRYKMDYRTVAIKMEINVNVVRRNWNTIKGKDEYLAIYTRHKVSDTFYYHSLYLQFL